MSVPILSGKAFLLITGASQGIGRQIAESFTPFLGDGSSVLLLARSVSGLQGTVNKLPKGLKVHAESVDLSTATADKLRDIINRSLGPGDTTQFERAIIVHNAASIGDLTKATVNMTDFKIWREYYDLNVFSPAVLNGVFMQLFNDDTKIDRLVINVTSYSGIRAFKSMGYYCSGKAAREMFFKVFAVENPRVNVLNYSPGPVKTDMLQSIHDIIGTLEAGGGSKEWTATRSAITTEQTVNRLIDVLKLQSYTSGDHVDYYNN